MSTTDLCKDEIEREIKIEFFKSVPSGRHKIIDSVTLNLAQLKENTTTFTMLNNKGTLELRNLKLEKHHSFLEYIFGGCEVDLSIAIDFTLSNGDPRHEINSLHCADPRRNQYMQAMNSVGNILQFYNTDKFINLYGFGAAVPPYMARASHCFALNGDIFNPRVNGIPEVLAHY